MYQTFLFSILLSTFLGTDAFAYEEFDFRGTPDQDEIVSMIQTAFKAGTLPTAEQISRTWNCMIVDARKDVFDVQNQTGHFSFKAFGHLFQETAQSSSTPWRLTKEAFYSDSFEDIVQADPAVTKFGKISPKGNLIVEFATSDAAIGKVTSPAIGEPSLFVYRYALCTIDK